MKKKKKYIEPAEEIIRFESEDIIVTSSDGNVSIDLPDVPA